MKTMEIWQQMSTLTVVTIKLVSIVAMISPIIGSDVKDGSRQHETESSGVPACDVMIKAQGATHALYEGQDALHWEYPWVDTNNGSKICKISAEDFICRENNPTRCQANNINVLYQRVICLQNTPFEIVFTQSGAKVSNHTSYLDLVGCRVSLSSIKAYGRATNLVSTTLEDCQYADDDDDNYDDDEANSQANSNNTCDITGTVTGLEKMSSLTVSSKKDPSRTAPNWLTTECWSSIQELDLNNVRVTPEEIVRLQPLMPVLQSLVLVNSKLSMLSFRFPWNNEIHAVPFGLVRSQFSDLQYVGAENLRIPLNRTRRLFRVTGNNLSDLSEHKFHGFLHKIDLTNCSISSVGSNTFSEVVGLQSLVLKSNKIMTLPLGVFKNLTKLTELDLSGNNLGSISSQDFDGLGNLRILNLANNKLIHIPSGIFKALLGLRTLDLSNNLVVVFPERPFGSDIPGHFTALDLSSNRISRFPKFIFTTRTLRKINLSMNKLSFQTLVHVVDTLQMDIIAIINTDSSSTIGNDYKPNEYKRIDLSYNNFTTLDYSQIKRTGTFKAIQNFFDLDLKGNNIKCDCQTYSMYRYLDKYRYEHKRATQTFNGPIIPEFYYKEWKCTLPHDLKDQAIAGLSEDEFVCAKVFIDCPYKCECLERAFDKSIIVNCTQRNLTVLPYRLPDKADTLLLYHNKIVDFEYRVYFQSLKELDLSFNRISTVPRNVFKSLNNTAVIRLHSNSMGGLPKDIQTLQKIRNLTLADNPYNCDCHMDWAVKWIRNNIHIIADFERVTCTQGRPLTKPIFNTNEEDFVCELPVLAKVLLPVCVLVIVFLVTILVWRKWMVIKVLVNYKFHFHPFNRNDPRYIAEKLYDAYVCYNQDDAEWVLRELQPLFENTQECYRLCLENRDFMPGQEIPENIHYGIKYSRRMIMVLSRNFFKNNDGWTRHAFKIAHAKALKRDYHLIVVIRDDHLEDLLADGDDDIKAHLNTAIRFSNWMFWPLLKYHMPEESLSKLRNEEFPQGDLEPLYTHPNSLLLTQLSVEKRKQHEASLSKSYAEQEGCFDDYERYDSGLSSCGLIDGVSVM